MKLKMKKEFYCMYETIRKIKIKSWNNVVDNNGGVMSGKLVIYIYI